MQKFTRSDLPAGRTGFEVVGEQRRLPAETELALFRIGQEAMTNVRKHAPSAGRVSVALVFEEEDVTLVVEDDGPGFEPAPAATLLQQGHLGLAGMTERARLLGGDLSVETAPGRGTTIVLRMPAGTAERSTS